MRTKECPTAACGSNLNLHVGIRHLLQQQQKMTTTEYWKCVAWSLWKWQYNQNSNHEIVRKLFFSAILITSRRDDFLRLILLSKRFYSILLLKTNFGETKCESIAVISNEWCSHCITFNTKYHQSSAPQLVNHRVNVLCDCFSNKKWNKNYRRQIQFELSVHFGWKATDATFCKAKNAICASRFQVIKIVGITLRAPPKWLWAGKWLKIGNHCIEFVAPFGIQWNLDCDRLHTWRRIHKKPHLGEEQSASFRMARWRVIGFLLFLLSAAHYTRFKLFVLNMLVAAAETTKTASETTKSSCWFL